MSISLNGDGIISGVSTFSNNTANFSGNVGVGTDNPIVFGTAYRTLQLNPAAGTGDGSAIRFMYDGGTANTNDLVIYTNTSQSYIRANGARNLDIMRNGSTVATFNANGIALPSGLGIDFSATGEGSGTMTSELLDDYEEGTWSPVPNGVTVVSGSPTYVGTYTRIGRAVHVSMFQTAGTITVAAGNYFTGLPFTPANYHNTGSWSCAATGKSGVTNVFTNSAIYIQQIISTGTSLTQFMTSAMYIV